MRLAGPFPAARLYGSVVPLAAWVFLYVEFVELPIDITVVGRGTSLRKFTLNDEASERGLEPSDRTGSTSLSS